MPFNEADTRAKLIDPALHSNGWTEDLIRREETAGEIYFAQSGTLRRRDSGRADYTLRVKVSQKSQPVAVALIEAKAENYHPAYGLEQAKLYASTKRLNVPFVYSSNGHQFVEYDSFTGLTGDSRPMSEFPSPDELRKRYEKRRGFALDSEAAKPLLTPYPGGEARRRYYQDAAIRATLEKIAAGGNRALLSLATGSGKTFIAVNLLKRIADAGQLRRALFVCDRDELRRQALTAFQEQFGADAAAATTNNPEKNARIVIATYQTLGVDSDDSKSSYLDTHYPKNYFSHVVIDECHRSAWGKWSEVLTSNPDAVHIGLTATPRELKPSDDDAQAREDERITANNIKYFGDPVYEYSIAQGMEDGYLAAMEIVREQVFLAGHDEPEVVTGIEQTDLETAELRDATTGEYVSAEAARERYNAPAFEAALLIPERVSSMCASLFAHLIESGGPERKTIIFCARDAHADLVAIAMNNLYAQWCKDNGREPVSDYAFKCTAAGGKDHLADIRGSAANFFVAATVDLLTTGVDVPLVTEIVFFKYVASSIAFYQMIGRGTRLHPPTNKLMFTVYDYTNATRLFGDDFKTGPTREPRRPPICVKPDDPERIIEVHGIEVHVNNAGTFIPTTDDSGELELLTLEQYKQRLTAKLVEDAPSLDDFREAWVEPERRHDLITHLPDAGRSPLIVRILSNMEGYDLYDVMAELAYGISPKTMTERADAFTYKNRDWLTEIPQRPSNVIRAVAAQFAQGGTDSLESQYLLRTPDVRNAGGHRSLSVIGTPKQILTTVKRRMFTA